MENKQQKSAFSEILQLGAIGAVVIAIVMSFNSMLDNKDISEKPVPQAEKHIVDTTVLDTVRVINHTQKTR